MNKPLIVNIPLQEIAGDVEFYRGTRFRRYGAGLNGVNEEDDYYEYMLVHEGYSTSSMMLVNVSSEAGRYKAGHVVCEIKMLANVNRAVVTAEAVAYSMGTERIFLAQEL